MEPEETFDEDQNNRLYEVVLDKFSFIIEKDEWEKFWPERATNVEGFHLFKDQFANEWLVHIRHIILIHLI